MTEEYGDILMYSRNDMKMQIAYDFDIIGDRDYMIREWYKPGYLEKPEHLDKVEKFRAELSSNEDKNLHVMMEIINHGYAFIKDGLLDRYGREGWEITRQIIEETVKFFCFDGDRLCRENKGLIAG